MNGIERYYTDLKNAIAIPTNDIEFLSRLNSSIKESNSSCMEDLLRPVSSWTTFFKYAYCPVINYFYVALRYGLFDEDSLSLLDRFFPRRIKYRAAEIFDIISKVSKENAMLIIDRMSESSDIYESLCEAYENDDETAFVEVITNNKLDTSKIKNICYLFSGFDHSSQKGTGIDLKKIIYTGIPLLTLSEHRTLEYQLSQIQESTVGTKKLYSVTLEIQNSLKKIDALFRSIPDVLKFDGDGNIVNISSYNEFVANWGNEWSRYENGFVAIAKKMFYILLKEDPQFSYQEQEVFDEMVTRPEVAEYFCQWKNEYSLLKNKLTEVEEMSISNERPTQLPKIEGFTKEKLTSLNEVISQYCEKGQNFEYFFGDGEYDEAKGKFLIWKGEFQELAYLLIVLYNARVIKGNENGTYEVDVFRDAPDNMWEIAQKIFVNKKGKHPQSLKTIHLEKHLAAEYSKSLNRLLIPRMIDAKRTSSEIRFTSK